MLVIRRKQQSQQHLKGLTPQERKEIQSIERETAQANAQASRVKDATVDATVRMVELGEDTKWIGISTLRQLDEQGGLCSLRSSPFFRIAG